MMRKKLLFLAALGLFQTLGVGQNALAHTDALRSDLKQLIVGDELECRLDGHLARRNQAQRISAAAFCFPETGEEEGL